MHNEAIRFALRFGGHAGEVSGRGLIEIAVHQRKVRMVEDVENFPPELDRLPLADDPILLSTLRTVMATPGMMACAASVTSPVTVASSPCAYREPSESSVGNTRRRTERIDIRPPISAKPSGILCEIS